MPRKKFPGGKICNVSTSTTRSAQSTVNKKHNEIEKAIDNLYDADFGRIFDPGVMLNQSIAKKKNNQREHREALNKLKKIKLKDRPANWGENKEALQEKLKRATLDLQNLLKQKKEIKPRKRISNLLSDLLKDRMYKAAFDSGYTLNIESTMSALRGFLVERTGTPFISLNDLPLKTLNLKYRTLKNWFDQQDKGLHPKQYRLRDIFTKGALRGAYEWSMANPAKVVLYRDKSLAAINLEEKILNILSKKSAAKVKYKDRYNVMLRQLQTFLESNNALYFPDPNNQPENPNKLTPKEIFQNERNVMELISDLMDGRTKYIEPQKSENLFKKRELMGKYNEIISYANRGGWNISKDIHEITVGDEVYYYVTLKDVDEVTGKEVYKAFLAPHYINSKKQTVFYYPLTKEGTKRFKKSNIIDKKSRNGAWVKAINAAQNTKKDITDVMTPGFRQAQTEKIFNGFNKDNKEINVKGYANYTQMDLDVNGAMFNPSIIRPGSKTAASMSLWKHIKDTRELLADIFEEWQAGTKTSLARIQETANKFPEIAKILKNNNVDEEVVDDTLLELKSLLNFNELLYIDDDGNVKSPNITAGIKDNYHPNMYETETYRTDLRKAITGMKQEVNILKDRLTQLKFKEQSETDPDKLRNLKAAKIRANGKIVELVGKLGDENKPGLIKILQDEYDQLMGKKEAKELSNVSTQSMIAYAKHRRLFTNKLKDSSPNVLYGGRRKDGKVVLDYIENVFNTQYNNELKSFVPEAMAIMDPNMIPYMLEEVKAGIGRRDLAAGVPFFDYSDKNLLKYIKKIPGFSGMTEDKLREIAVNFNSMTSGSLLSSPNVGLMNRMQGPTSSIVEIGGEVEGKVAYLLETEPVLCDEIAKESGVLDTVQAVADVFLGGLESQATFIDGFHSLKDILLLKGQNKLRFIKGANGVRRQMIKLIKRREGAKTTYNNDQLDAIIGGVYELAHGIAEGTLTEDDIKRLEQILVRVATKEQIRIFVTWGLNVFGLKGSVADLSGATQYLSMIEGEMEGRKIVVVRGAVYYADHIAGGKMAGDYLHPDAIQFGRQLVNNTMFQFSLQHFAKIFRGSLGTSLMKFKNYWVSQSIREWQIYKNFGKQLKGQPMSVWISEISKLFYPSKDAYIPYAKSFGFSSEEVGGINYKEKGPFPFIKLTLDTGTDSATESFRQFLQTRGLMSIFTVGSAHFFLIRRIIQFFNRKSPINFMSLGRGGESTTGTLALRIIQASLGTLYFKDEEEEDENMMLLYRIFFPMYFNVLADTIKSGDPFKITRLWGSFFSDAAEGVYDLLSDD